MLKKIKKIDYFIVLILVMLMIISIMSIFSVTAGTKWDGYHIRKIGYYVVGFVAFFGMLFLDYKILIKNALYIYLLGIALLVIVHFVGSDINNAQGWLQIPGLPSLQPAELFKLVLVIFLSYVLIRKKKNKLAFWSDVVPIGLLTFLPFALVMLQNDLGNALSYIVILLAMLWIGNIKFSHAFIGLSVIAASTFGGIQAYIHFHEQIAKFFTSIKRQHWLERIDPWLMNSPSWHIDNAKLAIASGGLFGEGFRQGTSVQSGRVPYTYSDSIFVQIAEEFGFVGASVLLLLYFILIHRLILIALETRDRTGSYLIVGVVAMLIYQIAENIGAFIGIMPLTGITLPFISYGGTSLLINMASVGLAMSVKVHGHEHEEDLLLKRKADLDKKNAGKNGKTGNLERTKKNRIQIRMPQR